MGLADRDYIRNPPRGRGGGGGGFVGGLMPRKVLSATVWLIIINVAVFAIDRVITGAGAGVATELGRVVQSDYTGSYGDLAVNTDVERPSGRGPGILERPLLDRETGETVGVQLMTRMGLFESIGYFSTVRVTELEVWRFVSFQFLHANGMHLLFNMVGLFFFGPLAERYLGSRRLFVAFYLMCGIAGALLYLLLNLAGWLLPISLPLVLANEPWVPLVGASAGVFGVLWAAAYVAGRQMMYVFGVIPMRIDTGVYLFTAIAFFNLLLGGGNAGGDAAHLGGAIAGAFFIRRPRLLLNFFDEFLGTSDRHPKFQRKGGKGGKGRGNRARRREPAKPPSDGKAARLDAILAKIKREGEGALTPAERKFLERETDKRSR